jgi:hypothetical protein
LPLSVIGEGSEHTVLESQLDQFKKTPSMIFKHDREIGVKRESKPHGSGWPSIINIALLIGGLGIGQGAIFAVQTWLVAKGEFDLLSAFGMHYSFAMLGIILIDGGSSMILARQLAHVSGEAEPKEDVWRVFWETSTFRAVTALLISSAAAVYAVEFSPDGFSRFYMLLALPGWLIWAGNVVGLLDGLKLSGISGITGSIAYATSAIGLVFAPHVPPELAGSILGGVFSVGYLLTVAAQWAALGRSGWSPHFQRPTRAGLIRSFKDGFALLFQFLPGQLILRFQLVLSTVYLGSESTALFVYAKQVIIALALIVSFVLRTDFPGLVQTLSRSKQLSVRSIFRAQRMTLYCAVSFTVGTIIASSVAFIVPQYTFSRAAGLLAPFATTILSAYVFLIMIQGLAALGAYAAIARIVTIGAVIAMLLSYLLITILHIYSFPVAEVTSQLVGAYLVYLHIRRRHT